MSRCISNCLRSVARPKTTSYILPSRGLAPAVRTYGHAAVQRRDDDHVKTRSFRSRESRPDTEEEPMAHERSQEQTREEEAEAAEAEAKISRSQEYLNRLLSPLDFPQEVAQRVLTHGSHRLARKGHNAGLSFIGRRVINSYFLLFLQSSPNLAPTDNIEEIGLSTLHTNLLGEHVGHAWGVGRAVVWTPSIPRNIRHATQMEALRAAGLYKIQGETVQAIMGAVYHQFGASVAHRVFHTRLLPLLRVNGGLPETFHQDVESIIARMGGPEGPLLLPYETEAVKAKVSAS